ncbi:MULTISPECIES: hypothetical protein [Streptomyces]|uniref:Uncharacterized protein n=1 Tax=Streptomyces virginiae TaxID=1961 RepID=A0ABZ1T442_STRVG|nr:hypothetical protein [Streptomyces virginiae]WTB20290.1 hypothetical protein OG253_01525 [Streptomyces virginiae]
MGTAIDHRLRLAFATAAPVDPVALDGIELTGRLCSAAGRRMYAVGQELTDRPTATVRHLDLDNRELDRSAVARSSTELSPWAVAGGDLDAEFPVGLVVPGASFAWDTSGDHAHTRLQVWDPATGSWAAVGYDGRIAADFAVAQAGPMGAGLARAAAEGGVLGLQGCRAASSEAGRRRGVGPGGLGGAVLQTWRPGGGGG